MEKGTDPNLPADLRKVLAASAQTKAQWDSLTPIGQRDFVSWIESAKQPQTRKRRVESVPSRLVGKAAALLLCDDADESLHRPQGSFKSEGAVETAFA
jgi:uncharacterized protein YdeI (YjbR/CyaY-like superfamily)